MCLAGGALPQPEFPLHTQKEREKERKRERGRASDQGVPATSFSGQHCVRFDAPSWENRHESPRAQRPLFTKSKQIPRVSPVSPPPLVRLLPCFSFCFLFSFSFSFCTAASPAVIGMPFRCPILELPPPSPSPPPPTPPLAAAGASGPVQGEPQGATQQNESSSVKRYTGSHTTEPVLECHTTVSHYRTSLKSVKRYAGSIFSAKSST